MKNAFLLPAKALALVGLAACTLIEFPPPRDNPRDAVVDEAVALLDRPYRFQGNNATGFDASGLVQYVYQRCAVELPHSAEGQRALGGAIPHDQRRKGDLLFYLLDDTAYPELHVGIYIGQSRMVHIPKNGRVQIEIIDTPYWQRRQQGVTSLLP